MKIILEKVDLQQIHMALVKYKASSDTEHDYVIQLAKAIECILDRAKLEYRP